MPKPTWSTQVGLAKEATYGTAVTPTAFLPVTAVKIDDKLTYVEDKGWRGAPVDIYDQFPGPATSDVSWDGPVYADSIGYMLAGVLGSDDVTGTSAPYAHAFTLNNTAQPVSYTLTDAVNGSIRQAPGLQISELSLKFDPQQLVTYSMKGTGLLSQSLSTRPTASYSAVRGSVGWQFVPSINGTPVPNYTNCEVTISRQLTPIYALGKQSAYAVYAGLVSASGKITVVMEDETQYNQYLGGSYLNFDLSMTNGTGATQTGMSIHASKAQFKSLTKDRSKDYVELQIDWTALANTADIGSTGGYSPFKVTLTNAVPIGTYM